MTVTEEQLTLMAKKAELLIEKEAKLLDAKTETFLRINSFLGDTKFIKEHLEDIFLTLKGVVDASFLKVTDEEVAAALAEDPEKEEKK
jgi:hypothetical protein